MTETAMPDDHFVPAGASADGIFDLVITPESAGWRYSSLRVLTVRPNVSVEFDTGGEEMILLPLRGSAIVRIVDQEISLRGRAGVFDGVTDFAYLPIESSVAISSARGGVFALPGAKATGRLPFRYGPASGVPIELRGAGNCSRQVNNFGTPGVFEMDKMIGVEVITPAGNWSSYPPHKHDETRDNESELEEIYYYLFRSQAPAGVDPGRSIGYQRVYGTAARPIEVLREVSDGDTVLVPHGWHGPSIAVPSHDMYYLNVMAGPEPDRSWKICDDPAHGWVRGSWSGQPADPRLPLY